MTEDRFTNTPEDAGIFETHQDRYEQELPDLERDEEPSDWMQAVMDDEPEWEAEEYELERAREDR